MTRAWRQYAVLAFLFICAAAYDAENMMQSLHAMRHPGEVPSKPFALTAATRKIGTGPLYRDEVLSINGRPLTSEKQYDEIVARAHPGDKLLLVLSEPSGRAVEKTVTVTSQTGNYSSPSSIGLSICLDFLIPLLCLILGFGVAFIRPRDQNAWLLLFLLTGFSVLVTGSVWDSLFPDLSFVWNAMWASTWVIWMLLFAIGFPIRFELDRRLPWLKYLILAPTVGVELIFWAVGWIWNHDINAAIPLRPLFIDVFFLHTILEMVGIGAFFAVLGAKTAMETAPDARRRLRILLRGTQIALGPMFLVALYSLYKKSDLFAFVPWPIEVTALGMMALFPITLAYVIVVARAMDLSFVVRQSVQYALARGGLTAARVLVIGLAVSVFVSKTGKERPVLLVPAVAGLVVLRRKNANRASAWIDRKFFREAYDAEIVLSELAVEAGRYVEAGPLREKVAERISSTLHVPDIVVLILEGDAYRTRYTTRAGEPMDIAADSRIVEALRERNAPLEVYFENPQPWIQTLDAEELQTLDFMRSQLLVALRGRGSQDGRITAILSLGPKMSEAPYSKTDIRLLQAVAWQMGMALENSRLAMSLANETAHREVMNRELEIAREVQERLFPQKVPKIAGVDCCGYCRPARGVGGDYYDFIELPDGRLGIAIGDVSGKGIAAALLMASLQASLRGQAMAEIHDLSELMRNVNKLVYDASQSNRYATFFYGEFDPATRHFAYVNAGHNAPIVLRGGEALRLEASGPVVGLLPGVGYTMDSCQLQPGDIFVGYTDGISEAMNERDEEWEEERFIAAARACARAGAKEMIEGIFRFADAFTGSTKQYDDMTLLVMKLAA